jgi:biotin-(acetyl-CoA carboxylase) ligase
VLARYREAQTLLGHPVRVSPGGPGGAPVDGVAEGVTADGALLLRLPSGRRQTVAYGEASLRPSPAGRAPDRPAPHL